MTFHYKVHLVSRSVIWTL